ncbi:ABC transporter ATP-binding protein [Hyphococcus luteus]|uniref:ABC transporter domain-containing protein n=1 Tax=Hyphococcus luteus TaxID=2058213 RepID=A0A2S7K7V1_9PROT|nr:ABC transporter ATP-binding protein [Marinicaulis flavus]PQA88597.1 hypothetical protein CW354_09965 [Marinicaulis flavus]
MILELDHISVSLKGRRILNDISMSAREGEFIGLIGPNGAGKSTLLRTAAGLLPVEAGTRRLAGAAMETLSPRERARALSYLPQTRPLYWAMPVRSLVALGRFAWGNPLTEDARDAEAVDCALAACGAGHLADRPASELSGGELSRVHLARALAGETPLLLADEPAAALDPAHQLSVMQLLRAKAEEGKAVIAALHDLTLAARYCTRIVMVHEGGVAADGAPKDVLTDDQLQQVFRIRARFDAEGGLAIHALEN